MTNRRLTISLVATMIAFAVNMGIGFFLTPYIVNSVSSEAYGFVTLANNFTNYATILTVALNSMAGRFITIAYHSGRIEDAKKYMSSAFFANVIICCFLALPAIICVARLELLVKITPALIKDVKILFCFVFMAFLISLLYAAFESSTFLANRKDLDAKRKIEAYLIKAGLLLILCTVFKPHVYYVGIASLCMALYTLIIDYHYVRVLTPELVISRKHFSIQKVKILISAGIWNSFSSLSSVLSDGLDLLITNLFISQTAMGTLSVAKQMPGIITTLVGTLSGVFSPNYTIAYAKGDREDLMWKVRQSMIILGIAINICIVVLVAAGKAFFTLWVPSQDAGTLQILSLMTIAALAVNGCIQCMFSLLTVANKIKANAWVSLGSNLFTLLIVFVLLKYTSLGIFAIASVSTVVAILRNLLFTIPYAAKCVNIPAGQFYKPVALNIMALIVSTGIGLGVNRLLGLNSWIKLILFAFIMGPVTILVNLLITTTMKEKNTITATIYKKGRDFLCRSEKE